MCRSSIATSHALFPPQDKTAAAYTSEINRGRTEERCLTTFQVNSSTIGFPFAEQAAQLTRRIESTSKSPKKPEVEYLITSRSAAQMNAEQMLHADRQYWGIENGLHQRLDVIAGEDRSRVQNPSAVLNLAVIRRAVLSVAIRWIRHCKDRRLATTSGFYDFMSAQNGKNAFKLVTASKTARLRKS